MPEITLIRHAESQANADGTWNGRGDGPLSPAGETTLIPLGERLRRRRFDLVLSSPLRRARETALAFATDFEIDHDLTEIDLGKWEGLTSDEILARDGTLLGEALAAGDVPMGDVGETGGAVAERALQAVDRIAGGMGEQDSAAVVTHGGVIQAILSRHLGGGRRRVHAFAANTSLQRLVWAHGRPRLATFNDTGHLGPVSTTVEHHLGEGQPVVALIRHGQTRANVEGRWQGQSDWGLDSTGESQAGALNRWYGSQPVVYSSPVGRAFQTAARMTSNEPVVVDGLKEINMGLWEGLTSEEILDGWPELMTSIYRDGIDLRRGETGESWGEMTARFRRALRRVTPVAAAPTVVVAHGGAIRAYISSLTVTRDSHSESLYTPSNTSVSHVAMTRKGPLILDYSVAAHTEHAS
jgi:broad specificity phosphatase PhoE